MLCIYISISVPHQVNSFLDFLDSYMRMNNGLLKLTELIKKNTEDPAVWSGVDNLQKTLRGIIDSIDSNDGDKLKPI